VDPDQSDQLDLLEPLDPPVTPELKEQPELLVIQVALALLEQWSPTLPQPPLPTTTPPHLHQPM